MTIINQLACSLNRRDEVPNQELAKKIAAANDAKAVQEVIDHLNNKDKNIASDCIKVVYEIGVLQPKLIAPFTTEIIALLDSKNNRMQWGAMIALHLITPVNPKVIYNALAKIIAVADKGSVITNDHCVGILIKLCAVKEYVADAFTLLIERLRICPTNQLPMYAENAMPIINKTNKTLFITTLQARLSEIEKDTKRIRVEKVIKKVNQSH
jgi:hypothetical protein